MTPNYYSLRTAFVSRLSPSDVPDDIWKQEEKIQSIMRLANSIPISCSPMDAAADVLLGDWNTDWAKENPDKNEVLERVDKLGDDSVLPAELFGADATEWVAAECLEYADGTYHRIDEERRLFLAERMRDFLRVRKIPIPDEISLFIGSHYIDGFSQKKEVE